MNDYCTSVQESLARIKAEELAEAVKKSNEFTNYQTKYSKLKEYPDKYDYINRIRRKKFEILNDQADDNACFNESDETMNNDPVIKDFMSAELELGRLIQDINEIITESIDIDTSFLN